MNRRTLLSGLAKLAIGLPLLEAIPAFAQAVVPKRLILVFSPNGTLYSDWKPLSAPGSPLVLGPLLQPLEPFKSRLAIVDGLNMESGKAQYGPAAGHQSGVGTLWTGSPLLVGTQGGDSGWGSGPSVDQIICDAVNPPTLQRSLQLGVGVDTQTNHARMIFRASDSPLGPQYNPTAAFSGLAGYIGGDPLLFAKLRARQKKVVDVLQAHAAELRPRMSSSDRLRVDQHLAALSSLETMLNAPLAPPAVCTVPAAPMPPAGNTEPLWFANSANYPLAADQQIQNAVMALACDLTRFASIQFEHGQGATVFSFLNGPPATRNENHHELSHADTSQPDHLAQLRLIKLWYAQRFAQLLAALDAVPEANGAGTMLDNTLVVWGNELGDGRNHSQDSIPFVVAGGSGVRLAGGKYLKAAGIPHNPLLVSICHALGATGVTQVGKPSFNSGPLPGLLT